MLSTQLLTTALEYMAPEVFEGSGTYTVDIYSLGAIFYQAVTGKLPIELGPIRADWSRCWEVVKTQIPQPPDAVVGRSVGIWNEVAMKCLEKDPVRRYQSVDDILKIVGSGCIPMPGFDMPRGEPVQKNIPANSLEDIKLRFINRCQELGITIASEKAIEYGVQLLLSFGPQKNTANIYSGKKGINIVLGGKTGTLMDLLLKIKEEIVGPQALPKKKAPTDVDLTLPPPPWIGTDESGKGDYFGPLVVAGVYVSKEEEELLRAVGVRDSKLLSDERALRIADQITKICKAGTFAVIEIVPERYNKIYEDFVKEGKNLNTLLAWGHARAMEDIIKNVACEFVIADQFGDPRYIESKLLKETRSQKVRIIQMPKAEQNIAVAAASILARAKFLSWLRSAAGEWGIAFPKGASPAVEQAAKDFITKHGRANLLKVAKLHFKITERI